MDAVTRVTMQDVPDNITDPAAHPTVGYPSMVRVRHRGTLGGVAGGLALQFDRPVRQVRLALVLLSLVGGFGVLVYVWLWVMAPDESGRRLGPERPDRMPTHRRDLLFGLALLAGTLVVTNRIVGFSAGVASVLPVLVLFAGAVLAWGQLDAEQRGRWLGGGRPVVAALRVAAGAVVAGLGAVLLLSGGGNAADLWRTVGAALAVLAGAGLVLAPWGVRLWRDLDAERTARAREAERAEVAAHLHDSVLQTLTLIQRRSGSAVEVGRLARAQERELRTWLYGRDVPAAASLAAALRATAAEVEDEHGAQVEVVVVGDRPLDDRGRALVHATREALLNAARHAAGSPVSLYAEASPKGVEVFVRDRGPGFDPDAVPGDRLGIRESVIGRMARHGGSASVRTGTGEGTEWRLELAEAVR